MKPKKMQKLLILGCLFTALFLNAQEQTLDCNSNLRKALSYLQGTAAVAKDSLKAIEYLNPCLGVKNANAQLIMGHLYLNSPDENNIEKGFQFIKKAAKQKHPVALENLGVLYKYGKGCKLNYNKARSSFKKAAKLGNHKAAYSLGYLYLKGLGNTPQDYKKAVQWFEKSAYPMAKYWLGLCYLKGYGVAKDIAKANALLETDFEQAQATTIAQTATDAIDTETMSIIANLEENSTTTLQEKKLYGKWTGKLFQLDWSGKNIEAVFPLELELKQDTINHNIHYKWKVNTEEKTGNAIHTDNAIYFENLHTTLPHRAYHRGQPKTLAYQIISSELALKNSEETTYLTGILEASVPAWKEPSAPMRFVLVKEKVMTENKIEISEAILEALTAQERSFIKLYPNPFISDLIIAYTLKEAGSISVQLTSIDGTENFTIAKGAAQKAGDYRYHFDGGQLKKGVYVVSVAVNGYKKTTLIVKK